MLHTDYTVSIDMGSDQIDESHHNMHNRYFIEHNNYMCNPLNKHKAVEQPVKTEKVEEEKDKECAQDDNNGQNGGNSNRHGIVEEEKK